MRILQIKPLSIVLKMLNGKCLMLLSSLSRFREIHYSSNCCHILMLCKVPCVPLFGTRSSWASLTALLIKLLMSLTKLIRLFMVLKIVQIQDWLVLRRACINWIFLVSKNLLKFLIQNGWKFLAWCRLTFPKMESLMGRSAPWNI